MAGGITINDARDLIAGTLTKYPDDKKFEHLQELRKYEVIDRLAKENRKEHAGDSVTDFLQVGEDDSASWSNLYDVQAYGQSDKMETLRVEWAHATHHWLFDRRELLMNKGPEQLFKLIETRRLRSKLSFAGLLEKNFWSRPHVTAAGEADRMLSLFYWANFLDDDQGSEGGYDGFTIRWDDGSTTTTKAGIDNALAANSRNRNWAATYTRIDQEFIQRLRLAHMKMKFYRPSNAKDIARDGSMRNQALYCSDESGNEYQSMAAQRGDAFGTDVEPFADEIAFRRVPIRPVDALTIGNPGTDSVVTAAEPWVFINFDKMGMHCLKGNWGVEHEPRVRENSHNTIVVDVDYTCQSMCPNVREGVAMLHKKISS